MDKEQNKAINLVQLLGNQKSKDVVINLIVKLVSNNVNICITGNARSGKCTLSNLLLRHSKEMNIRCWDNLQINVLQNMYPSRNFITGQDKCYLNTSQEPVRDTIRENNQSVLYTGELMTHEQTVNMLKVSNTHTQVICCHFCSTIEDLINNFSYSLLNEKIVSGIKEARNTIKDAISINIHLEVKSNGECYIARVSEIIGTDKETVVGVDIVTFDLANNVYNTVGLVSSNTLKGEHSMTNMKEKRFDSTKALHSLGVATLSKELARSLDKTESESEECWISGWIHDIGYSIVSGIPNNISGFQKLKTMGNYNLAEVVRNHSDLPNLKLLVKQHEAGIFESISPGIAIVSIANILTQYDGTFCTIENRAASIINRTHLNKVEQGPTFVELQDYFKEVIELCLSILGYAEGLECFLELTVEAQKKANIYLYSLNLN